MWCFSRQRTTIATPRPAPRACANASAPFLPPVPTTPTSPPDAISDVAVKKIYDVDRDPFSGAYIFPKGGKPAQFARILGGSCSKAYGSPCDVVVAIATNTLFSTRYQASDIYNLRTRTKTFAIRPRRKRLIRK